MPGGLASGRDATPQNHMNSTESSTQPIHHTFLNSDWLSRAVYHPLTGQLHVWVLRDGLFDEDRLRTYYGVPRSLFDEWRVAFSPGTFFNSHIRGHYFG